jgi:hypothetical protein
LRGEPGISGRPKPIEPLQEQVAQRCWNGLAGASRTFAARVALQHRLGEFFGEKRIALSARQQLLDDVGVDLARAGDVLDQLGRIALGHTAQCQRGDMCEPRP